MASQITANAQDLTVTAAPDKRPLSWVGDTDDRHFADAYEKFAAPENERRKVQIVRPFSALSKTTYSASILPPLFP